jgi:hypothetical protein
MNRFISALVLLFVLFLGYQSKADYDPTIQRFIQMDPIGEAGGINLYQFVGNNPVSRVDQFGLAYQYTSGARTAGEVFSDGVPGPFPYVRSEGWKNDRWFDLPLGVLNNALSGVANTVYQAGQLGKEVGGAVEEKLTGQRAFGERAGETVALVLSAELMTKCLKGPTKCPERPPVPTTAVQPAVDGRLLDLMRKQYHPGTDCSEIAEMMKKAAQGDGQILRVTPAKRGQLTLLEDGKVSADNFYHEVYTDSNLVYDPRFSRTPIPKIEWEKKILEMNPGATISPL